MGSLTPECIGLLENPSKIQFLLSIPAEGAWDLFKFPSEMGSVAHVAHLESKASYSPPGDKKGQRQSIDSEGLDGVSKENDDNTNHRKCASFSKVLV